MLRVLGVLVVLRVLGERAEVQVRQGGAVLAADVEAVLLTPALWPRARRGRGRVPRVREVRVTRVGRHVEV